MRTLLEELKAQLVRFEDGAFAALANKGLLRRARKDLEKEQAEIIEATSALVAMRFGGHRVEFDARGPSHATCSCPAHGSCQHVLAAAITLASLSEDSPHGGAISTTPASPSSESPPDGSAISTTPTESSDSLAPLRTALLEMTARALRKHAGKAGYRWAWQFVQDLDIETDLILSGERNVVIAFRHPPMTFR